MQFFLYIVLAIVILLVMILIHELGHYTAAKIFKFKVNEFSIGFGPKLFQKTLKNGEKFTFRAFPLGGYCAFEDDANDKGVPNERAFNKEKPYKRIVVLLSGALFNFISAILFSFIYLVSVGYAAPVVTYAAADATAYNPETGIYQTYNDFREGDVIIEINGRRINAMRSMPEILDRASPQEGETATFTLVNNGQTRQIEAERMRIRNSYAGYGFTFSEEKNKTLKVQGVSLAPDGTPYNNLLRNDLITKVNGQDASKKPLAEQMFEIKSGEEVTLTVTRGESEITVPIAKQIIFTVVEGFGFSYSTDRRGTATVTFSEKDLYGLAHSPLLPGDIITAVDGKAVTKNAAPADLYAETKLGDTVEFSVERNGQTHVFPVEKQLIMPTYAGFGFSHGQEIQRVKFGTALLQAVPFSGKMAWLILGSFGRMITGRVPVTDMSGPVGTVAQMAQLSQMDWRNILILLPLLAANLAIFNLLPFPALDGSKVIFTSIEWIRKKPIKRKIENIIHLVGIIALLAFVLIVDVLGFVFRGGGGGTGYLRL